MQPLDELMDHLYGTCDIIWICEMAAVNDSKRIVGVKNLDAQEILRHSLWLRGSTGRKTAHRVKKRHTSSQLSVQGGTCYRPRNKYGRPPLPPPPSYPPRKSRSSSMRRHASRYIRAEETKAALSMKEFVFELLYMTHLLALNCGCEPRHATDMVRHVCRGLENHNGLEQ